MVADAQVLGVPDEYPMTVTGKVQKFKLREQAVRMIEEGTLPDVRASVPDRQPRPQQAPGRSD